MARAVGIDIGSKSLKILELERSGNKFRVTFFHNLEIPFGSESDASTDVLVESIKNIFEHYHLEMDNVALALPTQESILREITVDFKDDNHIRQTIKYEVEKYLQAYEIDDVVVDYRKLQSTGEKTKLFVASVPKKVLAQRLKLLEMCHIDPMIMDLDIMGLVNISRFVPETIARDNVAILDFGAGSTKIVLLQKGQLRHIRAIRLGSHLNKDEANPQTTSQREIDISGGNEEIDWGIENDLIVSLAMPDGIDTERMVLVKKDPGDPSAAQQKKKEEFFKRIIKELGRTMMSLHLNDPIDLFCITGGGSQLEGIRERIEQSLHIPTILLDFSSMIQCTEENREEVIVTSPIALGMAMELLDGDCQSMNFRKEEYSYTNRFELMKKPLAVLVTLLFVFLATFCFYLHNQCKNYEKIYNVLLEGIPNDPKSQEDDNQIAEFFGVHGISIRIYKDESFNTAKKFQKIYNLYDRLRRDIDEQNSQLPSVEDAFLRWQIICKNFNLLRERNILITMDRITIEPQEASWEGEVENEEVLDDLSRIIRSIKKEIDPTPDKTRVQETSVNSNPSAPSLKRRYRFQVRFQGTINKDDF